MARCSLDTATPKHVIVAADYAAEYGRAAGTPCAKPHAIPAVNTLANCITQS